MGDDLGHCKTVAKVGENVLYITRCTDGVVLSPYLSTSGNGQLKYEKIPLMFFPARKRRNRKTCSGHTIDNKSNVKQKIYILRRKCLVLL